MSAIQAWISVIGSLTILAALAGLVLRGLWRACYSFTLYLLAVLMADVLISAWPGRFYRWDFWMLKEIVHNILKFAIALELFLRTFRAFPGARATGRGLVFLVLLASLVAVLSVPADRADLPDLASQIQPRILNGTVWLFTAVAVVILWYRLPVARFHKAILIGFVPYLLIFSVALNALHAIGWHLQQTAHYAHTLAYLALTSYWAWAAWRTTEEPALALGTTTGAARQV